MPTSEARIRANRENAAKSTGPKTPEGKAASRQNGLKHGMTGSGVVVPEADSDRIAERARRFEAEMAPRTAMGSALILQIATLSVRVERCFAHDVAATRYRVRHAGEAFDDERHDEVDRLLEALADDPRKALRKLKRMPEGVEALIDAWQDLRSVLAREPHPAWAEAHRERAENLLGRTLDRAEGSRVDALSRATRGDFALLTDPEAGSLDPESRRAWARSRLVDFIDDQINALEAHYLTLDFEAIEEDRAEAPDRALFDPSKGATLARRYESEALRNFHKALKEFRRVEAEAAEAAEAEIALRPEPSEPAPARGPLASSREIPPAPPRTPAPAPDRAAGAPSAAPENHARTADGRVLAVGRPVLPPA